MEDAQDRWEARNAGPQIFGRLRVLRLANILDATPRDYLLKGLMSPGEMSLWVGPPKCGKSFLMLYIAYAIAQERSVFGRRVKPVPVIYLAAEGEAGIAARVRALQLQHGDADNFRLIAQQADLLRESGHLHDLIAAVKAIKAGLVILDTASRVLAGGDENGPQDMGQFVQNVGKLREETGAHVAVVHHGTKSSNGTASRGHSSLVGAADAVIEVVKADDGLRTATVAMAKDDPDGAVMGFRLRVIELGEDQDGDARTTCIAEETDAPARPQGPALTPTENAARRFLADLIVTQGQPLPLGPNFPDNLHGVPEAAWREACDSRRLSTAEEKKDRERIFRRAYASLRNKAVVGAANGIVWLTQPPTQE